VIFKKRQLLFLSDAFIYTLSAFGGPQGHIAVMLREFVQKRNYITEEELMELNALAQVLPGPSSTQTLVGIAWKVGGLWLAIATFFLWILPSAAMMCAAAISYKMFADRGRMVDVLEFIRPAAVGIVAYATYTFACRFLKTRVSTMLAIGSFIATLILQNAYAFPILILLGGIVSSALETQPHEAELRVKLFANVNPNKLMYFVGVLLAFAALGAVINRTSPFSLPIRMFENFYRNGTLVFGGGQVLIPLLFTEFVEFKNYLSSEEFLSGYALLQALPGPTFSFTPYIGALAMRNYGIGGQLLGALAGLAIFLPGTFLIFFVIRFWNGLKKYRVVKASLEGINAVSSGMVCAAAILLFHPIETTGLNIAIVVLTFAALLWTRIPPPLIILLGCF